MSFIIKSRRPSKAVLNSRVNRAVSAYQAAPFGRDRSYDFLREEFIKNHGKNYDSTALYLFCYLSSWGMLRNSFLLQLNYKSLISVVKLLDTKYYHLSTFNPYAVTSPKDQSICDIVNAAKDIKSYFSSHANSMGANTKNTNATDTLVTKILLGTLGCTVAYDTNVLAGLCLMGLTRTFDENSLYELCEFAKSYKTEIDNLIVQYGTSKNVYTPMKILDSYFFESGLLLAWAKKSNEMLEKKKGTINLLDHTGKISAKDVKNLNVKGKVNGCYLDCDLLIIGSKTKRTKNGLTLIGQAFTSEEIDAIAKKSPNVVFIDHYDVASDEIKQHVLLLCDGYIVDGREKSGFKKLDDLKFVCCP